MLTIGTAIAPMVGLLKHIVSLVKEGKAQKLGVIRLIMGAKDCNEGFFYKNEIMEYIKMIPGS